MKTLIFTVIGLLVVTKLADVLTTLRNMDHPAQETNPIARGLMSYFGIKRAIWIVLGASLFIICLSTVLALYWVPIYRVIFVVYGSFVVVVQAATAVANQTGNQNMITRSVYSVFYRIRQLFSE